VKLVEMLIEIGALKELSDTSPYFLEVLSFTLGY
jgi:hypothetical protein